MRIALLRPDSIESPEGRLGAALARALPGLGAQVESFHVADTPLGEAVALAELFGRARSFELVHNLIGPAPLAFADLVPTPIVSTLRREPAHEELALLGRYRGRTWYVGGEYESPGGLECLAVIHTPAGTPAQDECDELARAYLEVYRRVVAEGATRRADRDHDRRPWGEYRVLCDQPDHKVKRIDVLPGKRLSYQRHARRAEHWTVVRGRAIVTLDGVDHELGAGQSIDIPQGAAHRVANPGPEPLGFVEVQLGSYFGEDDIERLEDDFGRVRSQD